ncbi:MAG: hypothetical protein R3264_07630, partial [Anaerolineae bacterium]|nr:hypothetical protein [Anaerolineae bacterium]
MKSFDAQALVEQVALLLASFVWTTVVLSVIALYWVYQDVNARWDVIAKGPSQAVAQAAGSPDATPDAVTFVSASADEAGTGPSSTPTATPWAGPPPTRTPSVSNQVPTPTPTQVVQAPSILPETLNADDPTPVPVIVHT